MTVAAFGVDVPDADLIRAIEDGFQTSVSTVCRRPWEYATSAPLELVAAEFEDGSRVELVLKHLGARAMSEQARRVKPAFVVEPRREIEVYRRLLAPLDVGARLVGAHCSPSIDTYWLLTRKVAGREMYQVGELSVWCACAAWLARMHERFAAADVASLSPDARLLDYDRRWYAVWMERALRFFASDDPPHSSRNRAALQWLAGRYERVIDRMATLPRTILHGEFYASNVLVSEDARDTWVCPVDWEMAALGPAVVDLAALTLGRWRDEDRRAVIAAYFDAARPSGMSLDDAVDLVLLAQIHLSVQWLGWFGRRRAPAGHRLDWLSDAVERAERLRL